MRRWILVLFVMLLPFRLWAAEAMALQMVDWPESPAQQMPCHGLSDEPASLLHTPAHDHGHHGLCLLCDVCHNALWTASMGHTPFAEAPRHTPSGMTEWVTSIALPPSLKPPIG
jgi:hypothetical protein